MRVREHDGAVPKPMVKIGNRPILWHLMKYYALLRPQGVHPLPRLQGRGHQGVLPQLQGVDVERLRAARRRAGHPAPELGHRRLADHLRRHRGAVDDRRAADGVGAHLAGEESSWRITPTASPISGCPTQLDAFQASDAIGCFMVVHSPQSFHVARVDDDGLCTAIEPLGRLGDLVQRRILRVPPRDLRLHPRRRRARGRAVPAPHRASAAHRTPLRGLLAGDGHVQGPARARGAAPAGRCPVAGLASSPRARAPQRADAMLTIGEGGLAHRRVLCLGAHSDDIEIGCGGTHAQAARAASGDGRRLGGAQRRGRRARARRARSAERFLGRTRERSGSRRAFRERYFPYDPAVKEYFDELGREATPDLVLCPWRGDAHQDHRTGRRARCQHVPRPADPGVRDPEVRRRPGEPVGLRPPVDGAGGAKIAALDESFPSQRDRPWFSAETFRGLMRLRGIESRRPGRLCRSIPLPEAGAAHESSLMTGTDGYIGCVMADTCMAEGHEVTGIDTGFYRAGWLFDGVRRIPAHDRQGHPGHHRRRPRGADAIVHLAELSNDPLGQLAPTSPTRSTTRAASAWRGSAREAGVTRFVYMSSCSVYGIGSRRAGHRGVSRQPADGLRRVQGARGA